MSEPGTTPQPWELAPITFTVGQLKQIILGYWFSSPPSSLSAANQELDMKLAMELASHQGTQRNG